MRHWLATQARRHIGCSSATELEDPNAGIKRAQTSHRKSRLQILLVRFNDPGVEFMEREEEIRLIAYKIWEEDGRPPGAI
jgi:hypothetical protein